MRKTKPKNMWRKKIHCNYKNDEIKENNTKQEHDYNSIKNVTKN